MIKVTSLVVYPVKSCAGSALEEADLGPRGILHDREWLVVDASTGTFLTQRENPTLALIRPRLTAEGLDLEAPGMDRFEAPIARAGRRVGVRVWAASCEAVDQGDDAARWLSIYLDRECRLLRFADDFVRKVDPDYATSEHDQVGFADGFPFLLISEESLTDLNARLDRPLPMNRFRPNIVIAGAGQPFVEDRVRTIQIGDVTLHGVKPCGRCVTTTIDQATALRGTEPLTSLATFRKVGSKVLFGQNMIHANQGRLRVGDGVEVLEWRPR